MKKYLRLFYSLLRYNLSSQMEYRSQLALWIFLEIIWFIWFILLIQVMYNFTDTIVGWSIGQVFVYLSVYKINKGIYDAFFLDNMIHFPNEVNRGNLDFLLTRPANTLFLSSFRKQYITDLSQSLLGVFFIIYAFHTISYVPSLINIIFFIISSFLGIFILYCLTLLAPIISIRTIRLNSISSYHDVIKNLLRYPSDIFSQNHNARMITSIFLAVIMTIPTKIILGQTFIAPLIFQIIIAAIFGFIVFRLWHFSLRHYSSASS